ncbi:FtsK/SpoIIIE domain-containing protein [Streptomyces sp. NPDC005774]|uniref:helix-turn-helix transcriptional regulator n=1 Tax=Streptomyces sp. NPDC005774 TaxID=3364728 RepID=UPI0036C98C18
MDKSQVSHAIMKGTSAAAHWTADRYRTEAARRRKLRTERKPLVADARKALAVARKADPERTKGATHRAERELSAAKRRVPDPMWLFASKAVVVVAVAGYVGLPRVPESVWLWSAVAVTVAAVGSVVVAVVAAGRKPKGLVPTAEERQLLKRLAPDHWRGHCEGRGLAGTITGTPKLTESGIVTDVRLDGQWTVGKLRSASEHVRALLGCESGLRLEIKGGKRGGWAVVTLRTRSAADGMDLSGWFPGAPWGVDTVTGEPVMVPLGRRMLIAGTSGSGKSWSTRALLAEASEAEDHRLVVIDPKRVEAINWEHRARTAITRDEVLEVTDELVVEMHDRLQLVPRGRDTIEISEERPRITVFVDEGAEVISMARVKGYDRVMENLSTLARMARAAEIILIWATQKPTMDSKGGIDPQISAQITYRAALALSTSSESRVVFGEDATEKGWHAHELPMPGVAMLRSGPKAKPHPINTRAFSPADVIALPDRPIWHGATVAPVISMRKPPAPPAPPVESTDERVLRVVQSGPVRQKDIVEKAGLPKGTVSKVVARLVEKGLLVRQADGTVSTVRTGATA